MDKGVRTAGFIVASLLLITSGLLWMGCRSSGSEDAEQTVTAEIHAVPVTAEIITPSASAVGTLEPMPGLSADILPTMPGRVLEIKVREGDKVAKGQLLIRMETSSRARAEHTQAKLALTAADLQAGRAKRLYEAGVWPKTSWEEADRALVAARSQEEATAVDARREAESAELKAPLAGVVSGLTASVGAAADGTAPLLKVVDASALLARLQVPAAQAQAVAVGAKATLAVPALPNFAPLETTVWKKALPLEAGNQYAQVLLRVENPRDVLAPGMAVEASLALPPRQGLVVPAEAVVTRNAATVVFRIDEGKAAQVPVESVELNGGRREVSGKGLKVGDLVATTGAYELSDGMAVKTLP